MRGLRFGGILVMAAVLTVPAFADSPPPRSARLVKDAGNQFLAAKKYADAIDCYFQALDLYRDFPEAHYNLGVAFLKGYKALNLALYHFERYVEIDPEAADHENVQALISALRTRVAPLPQGSGQVIGIVAGRLVVSGTNWVERGDRIEIADRGEPARARLLADYVYPTCTLTQRIWDEDTLSSIKPGALATNVSDQP